MKRYLVFAGAAYYPQGGWDDFRGDADTLDEARTITRDPKLATYWWHIVDTETKEEVACGDNSKD